MVIARVLTVSVVPSATSVQLVSRVSVLGDSVCNSISRLLCLSLRVCAHRSKVEETRTVSGCVAEVGLAVVSVLPYEHRTGW